MNSGITIWADKRRTGIFVITALILAALTWYSNTHISLATLALQENRLRNAIALYPWRSFWLGFGIYQVLALIPGTGGKAVVYGWLFGFWQALIIVTVGLTVAAMLIFSLSRFLFRESIEQRYAHFLVPLNNHLDREGAFYLLTLRMAHAPFSVINPACGASRIRGWTFLWTTVAGLLPANAIWVYVGLRLPSLGDLVDKGARAFIDLPLLTALVVCAALPVVIRWGIGHFGFSARPAKNHHSPP